MIAIRNEMQADTVKDPKREIAIEFQETIKVI